MSEPQHGMTGQEASPPPWWPLLRHLLLFVGGLTGVAHETLLSEQDRPVLLGLFAAMMGLPAFLKLDERRRG